MEEPSVLDYVKSKLKFWERGGKIAIPDEPLPNMKPQPRPQATPQPVVEKPARPALRLRDWPWRTLLAVLFILLGQWAFEPSPTRTPGRGLILYGIGLAWLVLAYLRKEWVPAELPETGNGSDTLRIRFLPLVLSIPFMFLAFWFFKGNLFTPLNLTLWGICIALFLWAFWSPRPFARPDKSRARENGPEIQGNVLANDARPDAKTSVVSASQGEKVIELGVPFATRHGGSLTLRPDGAYTYTPPVWDNVPPGGVREVITYTLADSHGITSTSTLTIDVNDSDRPLDKRSFLRRVADFFGRDSWTITATRWGLLILAVAGLVIFFRVYRINTVPAEPFSDHAEKILDVYEVTQGETRIFFPRNTGREAIQMYLTVAVAWLFKTGLSFLSLKIGTMLCGLATLPYMYLLGKEIGGRRVALLALFFAGIAYWPNVIARVGLRFPLYPLFVAPVLYYLIRGLRTRNRNDFILSGLFLGIGLHGYSPIRILPFVVVAAFGIYLLHKQSQGARKQAVIWLALLALTSFVIFLPLARYWMENPGSFGYRAFSRVGTVETELSAPAWEIFLSNSWNSAKMFNWDDGEIWVHSVTHRPALDVISGGLFIIGIVWVLVRYIKRRHWLDLFLLISIPMLQLPSTLSLAYPGENPALNRAGGALVPTFLIVAIALDGLITAIRSRWSGRWGAVVTSGLVLSMMTVSAFQNYDLVFNKYASQFKSGAWNSSEMGQAIKQFEETYGTTDSVWIVPYPYWVDTRLPGVWAGIPNRDFALWPEQFEQSLDVSGPKLFILKPEDEASLDILEALYPQGVLTTYDSSADGHDFLKFFVPPEQ